MTLTEKEKNPQCFSCKYYLKNKSCGPCATQGSNLIKNIANELGLKPDFNENEDINALKYLCKVLVNNPEDFNIVNPYDCKYFLNKALRF